MVTHGCDKCNYGHRGVILRENALKECETSAPAELNLRGRLAFIPDQVHACSPPAMGNISNPRQIDRGRGMAWWPALWSRPSSTPGSAFGERTSRWPRLPTCPPLLLATGDKERRQGHLPLQTAFAFWEGGAGSRVGSLCQLMAPGDGAGMYKDGFSTNIDEQCVQFKGDGKWESKKCGEGKAAFCEILPDDMPWQPACECVRESLLLLLIFPPHRFTNLSFLHAAWNHELVVASSIENDFTGTIWAGRVDKRASGGRD